jgi:hypothetical protein
MNAAAFKNPVVVVVVRIEDDFEVVVLTVLLGHEGSRTIPVDCDLSLPQREPSARMAIHANPAASAMPPMGVTAPSPRGPPSAIV